MSSCCGASRGWRPDTAAFFRARVPQQDAADSSRPAEWAPATMKVEVEPPQHAACYGEEANSVFFHKRFNPETKLENAVRFEEKLDLEPFCHISKNFATASSETVQVHLDRCGDACRHSQYRAVTTGRLCARRPISGLDVTTHALKKPI